MLFRSSFVLTFKRILSIPFSFRLVHTQPRSPASRKDVSKAHFLPNNRVSSYEQRWLLEIFELNELRYGLKRNSLETVSKSISKLVELRSGEVITVKEFMKVAQMFTHHSVSVTERNKKLELLRYSLSPCIPSVVSTQKYSYLLRILCKLSETAQVKSILNEMSRKKMHPETSAFNHILDFLADKEFDYALKVFREACESLFVPDVATFTTLIKRGKSQDVSIIYSLHHEFSNAGLVPTLKFYNILVDAYTQLGDISKARKMMDEMRSKNIEPNIVTYSSLINGFVKLGDTMSITQLYNEIIARNIKPDVILLTTLMKVYGDRSDAVKVLDIYQMMRQHQVSLDVRAYTTLIHALTRTSADTQAYRVVLEEMEKEGLQPNVVTYSILIDAYAKAGDISEAHRLFNSMKDRGIMPDKIAYDILIQGYVRMGHGHAGKQLYDEMLSNKILPKEGTYVAVAPFLK
ncbi:hypothetical protein K7432_001886 [Basidiobolus ranarum]|uniref:Pentatricopeptide repeat-containing protein n=1 Tax=Basidiobolus ranarum TaxID=34480 RepID=A0ABR2X2M4_9FUNG